MAGISREGLTIRRQGEVIRNLKDRAVPIFQDLVPPNDSVDVSDDSTIGRMIGLYSLPIADLWEAVQEVYLAFDPNSATGIALDNLVSYAGLTRQGATPTTAQIVVWGDENTTILADENIVRAVDNTLYDVSVSIQLTRDNCVGFVATVENVVAGQEYRIVVRQGSVAFTASHVASVGETANDVADDLYSQLNSQSWLYGDVNQDSITIEASDIHQEMKVSVTNISISKVKAVTSVISQEAGFHEQLAGEINQIATPILGWDSVNNPNDATPGRDEETDDELRNRFRESKSLRAQNISDSLYSALMAIEGVSFAAVYENTTDQEDSELDLPPHSFKVIVDGGTPEEIARAIWINKPLGIDAEGNLSVTIKDSQGFDKEIKYNRPNPVQVYIKMSLTRSDAWPSDGEQLIRSAILDYIRSNQKIGGELVYSRLYTPINSVPGHQVDELYVGTTPNPTGNSNISVNYDEYISVNSEDIEIDLD